MVLLNWFSKVFKNLEFKFDHSNSKWIDVGSVIAIVTLSYLPESRFHKLQSSDRMNPNEFVSNQIR